MRTLGLDVGLRRVGVAISDPTGMLARTLAVIKRGANTWTQIAQWVHDEEVGHVVVGYPLLLDGTKGAQTRDVDEFVQELERHVSVPIHLWDERFSTVTAQRLMISAGRNAREREKRIDAAAAAVILQDYLDAERRKE